ncbi:hypothetical protein ACHAWF_017762 [Thalassiosira exigua]
MASVEAEAFPSLDQLDQLPAQQESVKSSDSLEDHVTLEVRLTQLTGLMEDSPSYVCEWITTSLRLPSQQGGIFLCLPAQLTEATYVKQNEEKEEYKDDGYCSDTAARMRLSALDRYLATVPALKFSAQRLLFGGPTQTVDGGGSKNLSDGITTGATQCERHDTRGSKQDPRLQFPMHRPVPSGHRLVTATNSGRVINVLQGEIAHCSPSQADLLVSDDATTCHIVALWSRYSKEGKENNNVAGVANDHVLSTIAHIDGPKYEASLRDAVKEHVKYHCEHFKNDIEEDAKDINGDLQSQENIGGGTIELSIHIMGGFNDSDGSSIEITDDVLWTLAGLSNEYSADLYARRLPQLIMTLETCVVSSANDDGTGCPLGRGLALEVATGAVFLAEVECSHSSTMPSSTLTRANCGIRRSSFKGLMKFQSMARAKYTSAEGPEVTLRSTRLWASAFHSCGKKQESKLHVIHRPGSDYLCIDPFFFGPHSSAKGLLRYGDQELIQITSTSPEVEKPNFVTKVREALAYMNSTNSARVFNRGQTIEYERVGLNGWTRCS